MTAERDDIIRDLLRNEPTGDYSPQQLFALNIHSRYCAETAIYEMYYSDIFQYSFQIKGAMRGALTRRSNRLWGRLAETVDAIRTVGGSGIYRVWICIDTVGYTWAADLIMAQRVADTMFGYLAVATGQRNVKVTYMRHCVEETSEAVLKPLVDEMLVRVKREISEAQRSIAMAEKKLAQALAVLELVDPCKTDDSVV